MIKMTYYTISGAKAKEYILKWKKKADIFEMQKYYQTNQQKNENKRELGINSHLGFQCIKAF